MDKTNSLKDRGIFILGTISRAFRDGEDHPEQLMRFGFKYGSRISMHEFALDRKIETTILVVDSFEFDGILIDTDNPDMGRLEKIWEMKLFQNLFLDELFVEMHAYSEAVFEDDSDTCAKSQKMSKANIRKLYDIQNYFKFEDFFTHLSNLESKMRKDSK